MCPKKQLKEKLKKIFLAKSQKRKKVTKKGSKTFRPLLLVRSFQI
jgi:hypothetical protein